jgi:hypothetical protein
MDDRRTTEPVGIPLRDIDGQGIERYEKGDTWYRVVAKGAVSADIVHPEDAFLCRLESPVAGDVVQLSCGRVRSTICDCLYSPADDLGLKFRGKGLTIEWCDATRGYRARCEGPLLVHVWPGFYKSVRKLEWYRPMDRQVFSRAPAGWCSWYYYYLRVDEAGILRNVEWLRDHLARFGLRYAQIDDGWQGRGGGFGGNRDWQVTCEAKFPHGMKWLADEIRKAGMVPGIWLIPFTHSDPKRFAADPGLFVRHADGRSVFEYDQPKDYGGWIPPEDACYEWCGRYFLDATHPGAIEYLRDLFRVICREWGYDYVKIDGQGGVADAYRAHRARLRRPEVSGDEAYRAGLEAIRGAMGQNRFLLNCGAGWDSAGLCDGIRIGGDVSASLDGLDAAVSCTMRHLYLNHIAWWTDPDVVCVRDPLTLEQVRVWVTLLGITGQLLMTSDDMPALPEERIELLRRVLPVADIRPMELYELKDRPGVFDLKVNKPGVGEWDVVAVFNWSRAWTRRGPISAKGLGIPHSETGFLFFDVWAQKLLAAGVDGLTLEVPPMECRVLCIRRMEDRPQFIGSSRHLTQGTDDVESLSWDESNLTLAGVCRVVAGDPCRVLFTVPRGWKVAEDGVEAGRGVGAMTLAPPSSGPVAWRVRFARRPAARPRAPKKT